MFFFQCCETHKKLARVLEKDEESMKKVFANFHKDMQSLNSRLASKLKEIKDIVSVVFAFCWLSDV